MNREAVSTMSDAPTSALPAQTHAAALSVEIRTPLARIELAASQLFREALTPGARGQAEQIFEAVGEVDSLIERMLRVLVPPRRTMESNADLALVISELRRRFVPAFAACGVDWVWRDYPREPVRGNVDRVRRLGTSLLHLALTLSGSNGQFTLDATRSGQGVVLSLFCRRTDPWNGIQIASADAVIAQAQDMVFEEGGLLTGKTDASTSDLRLRVPDAPMVAASPVSDSSAVSAKDELEPEEVEIEEIQTEESETDTVEEECLPS